MGVVIWEQDGKKEVTIMISDGVDAYKLADILRTKKIEMVWVEEWTGIYALRIEYSDPHTLS